MPESVGEIGRESAMSTVALRKPSFSPVSWRRP